MQVVLGGLQEGGYDLVALLGRPRAGSLPQHLLVRFEVMRLRQSNAVLRRCNPMHVLSSS